MNASEIELALQSSTSLVAFFTSPLTDDENTNLWPSGRTAHFTMPLIFPLRAGWRSEHHRSGTARAPRRDPNRGIVGSATVDHAQQFFSRNRFHFPDGCRKHAHLGSTKFFPMSSIIRKFRPDVIVTLQSRSTDAWPSRRRRLAREASQPPLTRIVSRSNSLT